MTPKEKAREIVSKFIEITPVDYKPSDTPKEVSDKCDADVSLCKQCALIAINEIVRHPDNKFISFSCFIDGVLHRYTEKQYWEEVRNEIEKL